MLSVFWEGRVWIFLWLLKHPHNDMWMWPNQLHQPAIDRSSSPRNLAANAMAEVFLNNSRWNGSSRHMRRLLWSKRCRTGSYWNTIVDFSELMPTNLNAESVQQMPAFLVNGYRSRACVLAVDATKPVQRVSANLFSSCFLAGIILQLIIRPFKKVKLPQFGRLQRGPRNNKNPHF